MLGDPVIRDPSGFFLFLTSTVSTLYLVLLKKWGNLCIHVFVDPFNDDSDTTFALENNGDGKSSSRESNSTTCVQLRFDLSFELFHQVVFGVIIRIINRRRT